MGALINSRRPGLAGCHGTRFNPQTQWVAHFTPKRNRQGGFSLARKTRIDTRLRGSKTAILGLALLFFSVPTQADEIEPEPEPVAELEPEPEPEPQPEPEPTLDSGWTPFQAALANPIQIFSEETDVHGLRINLPYGNNADFRGVDLGVAGITKSAKGVQANLFYNEAEGFSGLQLAGIARNLCVDLDGVQVGTINTTEGQVRGWQFAFLASEAGNLLGGQVSGIHNRSRRVVGLQIAALVNEADDLRGLQIGLLNFNRNGILPFFPIFNFGFGSDSEAESSSDGNPSDTE
jgi:hypothetical protein